MLSLNIEKTARPRNQISPGDGYLLDSSKRHTKERQEQQDVKQLSTAYHMYNQFMNQNHNTCIQLYDQKISYPNAEILNTPNKKRMNVPKKIFYLAEIMHQGHFVVYGTSIRQFKKTIQFKSNSRS